MNEPDKREEETWGEASLAMIGMLALGAIYIFGTHVLYVLSQTGWILP